MITKFMKALTVFSIILIAGSVAYEAMFEEEAAPAEQAVVQSKGSGISEENRRKWFVRNWHTGYITDFLDYEMWEMVGENNRTRTIVYWLKEWIGEDPQEKFPEWRFLHLIEVTWSCVDNHRNKMPTPREEAEACFKTIDFRT